MTSLASNAPTWRQWWRIIPVLFLLGTLVTPAAPAYAHPVCGALDSVTIGKMAPITGTMTVIVPEAEVRGQTAIVVGKFVTIIINLDTFTVVNLVLRGTPDPTGLTPKDWELITGPAPAPPSSSPPPPPPSGSPPSPPPDTDSTRNSVARLQGALLVQLSPENGLVIQRGAVADTMKIQVRNCTQGEVIWIEAGQMTTTTIDMNLSAGLRYGQDEYGRTIFNTGTSPTPPSYTYQLNRHEMNGRLNAVGAARTLLTSNGSRWVLSPGGRVGIILGEEALEYTLPNGRKVDARTCVFIP